METEKQQVINKIFTPANLLSVLRLVLLPVFWALFVNYQENLLAFIVILVAALTDMIDGQLARSTGTVSRLGKQLDPLVDRIFILVAVLAVFVVGRLPFWILMLLIARDLAMFALTIYQKVKFDRDFQVIFLGKLTTAALMAGFCSLVLWWPVIPGMQLFDLVDFPGMGSSAVPIGYLLLYLGVLCSWSSAGIYIVRGLQPPASAAGLQSEVLGGTASETTDEIAGIARQELAGEAAYQPASDITAPQPTVRPEAAASTFSPDLPTYSAPLPPPLDDT